MKMTGEHYPALIADMEAGLHELAAPVERDPSIWNHGRAGRWTVGQHVEHLATAVRLSATVLERRLKNLRDGTLRPPGRRGPVQAMFVRFIVGGGWIPRGAKAPKPTLPSPHPDREAVLEQISRDLERHRVLGLGLSPSERDRLWVPNPFMPQWHYRYPEMLRMHGVHARHHARQIEEIASHPGPRATH